MKGVSSAPGDYIYFKSQVPLHKISIGSKQWRYYDFGPKIVPPLICLPGIAGTADVYYKQIMSLSMKGYRVISVDIPRAWNHVEWIQAFEKFLDTIDVHHVHLYGSSLGGFLAQLFAQHRPRRVRSLILSNSFLDTRSFKASMLWSPIVSWTPSFLLKRYILTGIRDGPHEPFIADSVDFVVCQVETLSRDDLASRLSLNVDAASVGSILLSDSFITIMDTNDYCAIPQQLKDQLSERYPGARRAYLKTGGDFSFLSRPDEVNLHLQLHLRRVGVEARPDLVPGTRRGGNAGSSSNDKDESEDIKDPPKESGDGGKDPPKDGGDVGEDPPKDGGDEDEDTPKDCEDGDEDIDDTQDGGDEDKDPPNNGGDGGEDNNDPSTDGGDGGLDANDTPENVGDGAKDVDNPPKDHEGPSTSAVGDSAPAHGTNNSHTLDEPVLNSAKTCLVDCKLSTFVIPDEHLLAELQTALNCALVLSSLSLLPLYMVCCCTLTRKPLLIV